MKNLKKNANLILLTFILSSFILAPFGNPLKIKIISASNQTYSDLMMDQIKNKNNLINSQDLTPDATVPNKFDINNWDEMVQNLDQNRNGIDDQFDLKLISVGSSEISIDGIKSLSSEEVGFSNVKQKLKDVNFIIQFLDEYNYSSAVMIFENNDGIIKHTYKEAINGFAGKINYEGFIQFCELLKQNEIIFFIEEDNIAKASLYYVSRNMNLRPYVWNTLGYTGDDNSSIAILDTGIDDSHEFFDNYTDGDFTYKIVAWDDEVGGSGTPIDDNGHGSHVAGIAAGQGTPVLDGLGRSVATESFFQDFTPWAYIDGYSLTFLVSSFNVTETGVVEIECNFTDFTDGLDRIYGRAILYKGNTQLDIIGNNSIGWEDNLTVPVTAGIHQLAVQVTFGDFDIDGDPYVWDPLIRFRGEIHWPFDPDPLGSGNIWKGVAPNTHLVGVKVLDANGAGTSGDIIDGIDWVITNRETYNITVMSMSLGLVNPDDTPGTSSAMISAVNNAVENGIVVVAAAGNDGPGGNNVPSPGDADNAIAVAAMNYNDQVTYYSSQGGSAAHQNTTKPDIMAPGGSVYDMNMFSADTNDNDLGGNLTDQYADELMPAQGTSMATPAVAGAANLLIQAMGGGNSWDWTPGSTSAKMVKAILLMTATETYGLQREVTVSSSPILNRGGKDVHEGYGRINVDAAIEAWINDLSTPSKLINISVWLNTSQYNSYGKHAYAGYVDLMKNDVVIFNLTVPNGADYDLYLYNSTSNEYGEPVIISSSISANKGGNEIINYTATHDGKFFLVVKAIGEAIPGVRDDDDDKKEKKEDLFWFYLILIIAIVGIISMVALIIIITRSRKKSDYNYIEY